MTRPFDQRTRWTLVTGSRTWTNPAPIAADLDARLDAVPAGGSLVVVVGYDPERQYPPGVDELAYEYCESVAEFAERAGKSLIVETYPVDWQAPCRAECDHGPRPRNRRGQEYCPAAGDYRNARMVQAVAAAMAQGADGECLAFVDPCVKPRCRRPKPHDSHGAADTIARADAAGIEVRRWPR